MDGEDIINMIWRGLPKKERDLALTAMRLIIKGEGGYAVEDELQLRALALAETDLMDPDG